MSASPLRDTARSPPARAPTEAAKIPPAKITAIASHGQTICHLPFSGLPSGDVSKTVPSTLQLGDPSIIATLTGIPTIGNFRTATISSGVGDNSGVLSYPANGTGQGQFIIGTFVADASGTQSILIDPSQNGDPNSGSAQINLVQVRDLGVIPEPSCMALAGLGLLGLLRRRK